MDRGAWWVTVLLYGFTKELDMTKKLNTTTTYGEGQVSSAEVQILNSKISETATGNPKGMMLYLEVNDVWGLGLTRRLTVPAQAAAESNLACTAWKGLTGRRGQRGAKGAENPGTSALCQALCTYPIHTASFRQAGLRSPISCKENPAGSEMWCAGVLRCAQLCDPVDHSPPGSSVRGISQARMLEWVAISYSRDLPDPGIKPKSPAVPALAGGFFIPLPPEKPPGDGR